MKRIRKPVWAIALSLALCLCLLPGTALAGSQDVLEAFYFDNNRPDDYGSGATDGILTLDAEGVIRFSVSGFVTVPEAAAIEGVYLVAADNSATRYDLLSDDYGGLDHCQVLENPDPDSGLTDYSLDIWIEDLVIPDAVPGNYRLLVTAGGTSYYSEAYGDEYGSSDGLVRVQDDPDAPFALKPRLEAGELRLTAACPADLERMTLYGVRYSAEGRMLGLEAEEVVSGGTGSLSITFGDSAYVKLFALGPDAAPICDSVRVEASEVLPESSVTGVLTPEFSYLSLHPGESAVNRVTAYAINTQKVLLLRCEVDDPALLTCDCGAWEGPNTPVELNLVGKAPGDAEVTVTLYLAGSETLLDSCSFSVHVESGILEPEADLVELEPGKSETLSVRAEACDGRSVKLRCDASEAGLVSYALGERNGDSVPLILRGQQCGSVSLRLLLLDAADESVLAERSIYVRVVGGSLSLSEAVLTLRPGEQRTVTVTGAALDPSAVTRIASEDAESEVIDWTRGVLGSGEVSLTVTALAEGTENIALFLLDANGRELNSAQIQVYVSK